MADSKLTALSAIAAVMGEDLVYVVDDPSGSPVSNKVTIDSFFDLSADAGFQQILPQANVEATPTLDFGGNAGIYSAGPNQLNFSMGGTLMFRLSGLKIENSGASGSAWQIGEVASTTNPVFTPFDSAADTGVGGDGTTLNLIADGLNILQVDGTVGTKGQVLLPQESLAASPTLAFGDGDSGFFEHNDDQVYLSLGGSTFCHWNNANADLFMGQAAGAGWVACGRGGTSILPSIGVNTSDGDTGIGFAALDQLSLIAGGVEGLRVEEGNNGTVGAHMFLPNLTTAPTGDPTAGGYLYVEAGALKYRGSSSTITTIANA
jgi:hypothetical protein